MGFSLLSFVLLAFTTTAALPSAPVQPVQAAVPQAVPPTQPLVSQLVQDAPGSSQPTPQQRLDATEAGCTVPAPFTEPGQGFPTTPADIEFCSALIHFWTYAGYQVINGYMFGTRSDDDMLGGTLYDFLRNRRMTLELRFGSMIPPTEPEIQATIGMKQTLGACPFEFVNADLESLNEHIHNKAIHAEWEPKIQKIFGATPGTPSYITDCMKYQADHDRKNSKEDVLFRGTDELGFGAPVTIDVGAPWSSQRYTSTTWVPFLTNFINSNMLVLCGLRNKGMVITDRGEDEVLFAPGQLSCTVEHKITDTAKLMEHPLVAALPERGANPADMPKIKRLWFMKCGQSCSASFDVDADGIPRTRKSASSESQTLPPPVNQAALEVEIGEHLELKIPGHVIIAVGLGLTGLTLAVILSLNKPHITLEEALLEEL